MIVSLVDKVRRESGGGGFVKQDENTGLWYEIGDEKARDKVGHAIRRCLVLEANRSSSASSRSKEAINSRSMNTSLSSKSAGGTSAKEEEEKFVPPPPTLDDFDSDEDGKTRKNKHAPDAPEARRRKSLVEAHAGAMGEHSDSMVVPSFIFQQKASAASHSHTNVAADTAALASGGRNMPKEGYDKKPEEQNAFLKVSEQTKEEEGEEGEESSMNSSRRNKNVGGPQFPGGGTVEAFRDQLLNARQQNMMMHYGGTSLWNSVDSDLSPRPLPPPPGAAAAGLQQHHYFGPHQPRSNPITSHVSSALGQHYHNLSFPSSVTGDLNQKIVGGPSPVIGSLHQTTSGGVGASFHHHSNLSTTNRIASSNTSAAGTVPPRGMSSSADGRGFWGGAPAAAGAAAQPQRGEISSSNALLLPNQFQLMRNATLASDETSMMMMHQRHHANRLTMMMNMMPPSGGNSSFFLPSSFGASRTGGNSMGEDLATRMLMDRNLLATRLYFQGGSADSMEDRHQQPAPQEQQENDVDPFDEDVDSIHFFG